MEKRLRYGDLVGRGLITNRQTLRNWIARLGFPQGQLTGPNTRTWSETEIEAWIASRPTAPKAIPEAKRPRGRPRKTEPRNDSVGG